MGIYDPFHVINRLFAEIDHGFREVEDEWHVQLPTISVPSFTQNDDVRVYSDGKTEKHFKNGALHRLDGPAVITFGKDGKPLTELYYIEGERTTKEAIQAAKAKLEDEKIYKVYLGNKAYTINGKQLKEVKNFIESFKTQQGS